MSGMMRGKSVARAEERGVRRREESLLRMRVCWRLTEALN